MSLSASEGQQPAAYRGFATIADKDRIPPGNGRLLGGGRSPVRTRLRPDSLVAGKTAGNFARCDPPWRPQTTQVLENTHLYCKFPKLGAANFLTRSREPNNGGREGHCRFGAHGHRCEIASNCGSGSLLVLSLLRLVLGDGLGGLGLDTLDYEAC